MSEELLTFNGIDATSGEYLVEPTTAEEIRQLALGERFKKTHISELSHRDGVRKQPDYAPIPEVEDPSDLSQSGWGVIFPADAKVELVDAIEDALGELLGHREVTAGDRYQVYRDGDGYRQGETKDDFLKRHGSGPGPVDPDVIPFYLLIVGDPQSIPYEFQYELDVQHAVGRIHFDTLDEFAQYARSVVVAETGGVRLPRQAVFFGVANEGDRATEYSAEMLIKPLAAYIEEYKKRLNWESILIEPDDANKARLSGLLGGDETPAFIFTASHGLGFPNGHKYQLPFQGALLCDTAGPIPRGSPISRDYYLGGEDIASDANLLGLMAFHFACFGGGTPYLDDYSKRKFKEPEPIAPYAFLSSLPKRMLSHPNGGALAIVGHIDRAWSYSFKWGEVGKQTKAMRSVLYQLLRGKTLGEAMDYMNLRYAEIAVMLNTAQSESRYSKVDAYKLAGLWTASNDARGFTVIGDPAVRLPLVDVDEKPVDRTAIEAVVQRDGEVAAVMVRSAVPGDMGSEDTSFVPPPAQPETKAVPPSDVGYAVPSATVLDAWVAMSQRYEDTDVEAFGIRDDLADKAKEIFESMTTALTSMTKRLAELADDVSGLDVVTYVSEDMESLEYKGGFTEGAQKRAFTHISIDGDTNVCVPMSAGELDETLWMIHNEMVHQAMINRMEMVKTAAEMLTNLMGMSK
jgi:hypothetical protein